MAVNRAEKKTLDYALRALQLIFAIIVMGTDGYAIHVFRGHTVYEHSWFGNFYDYYGVPDAWGFLMFCAAWTVLIVIFHLIAGISFADRVLIGYIRVAVEAVAVLSWLAVFIAVAVQISTDTCSAGKNSCGTLKAATIFGAFEWLLFMVTAALTVMLVFNSSHKPRISTTRPDAAV
ncbi:transcriptional regulator family: Fungal Specific TF [Penicillium atrosanguineum]|uniref:transcriptional regulator family: Fungal Specific TF n=1 Tax=Penicillium atrosanguineum TaxID=1132637 RepID=UPI00239EB63E|nr:transcriptional regulator family: Fungal Specific TF [Penicillium atrosanguineum]KAJ5313430.1 transcriptional regulator family: Fungal Specific TF [Penicillium atrosanguineum]